MSMGLQIVRRTDAYTRCGNMLGLPPDRDSVSDSAFGAIRLSPKGLWDPPPDPCESPRA